MNTFVALLRGINVGGHHKVPMAALKSEMVNLGFEKVTTLLNSGNVIFDASSDRERELEDLVSNHLEKVFGFPIPAMIRKGTDILNLIKDDPFQQIEMTKDIRLYISFLKEKPEISISLPWSSEDDSYQILEIRARLICSVLDLSAIQTTKGMGTLEQIFGKNITTRNWNTVKRIAGKIEAE